MKHRPDPEIPAEADPDGPPPTEPDTDAGSNPGAPPAADPTSERVASLEDGIRRIQADFLTETRRIRTQADADRAFAIQRVVVDLLPVADALHGAATTVDADPEATRFKQGIDLVVRQLDEVLARHGVT